VSEPTRPDIAIFIPCLNEERYVVGAIQKVVDAARRARITLEIIVIDDGSTDRTSEVVSEYARTHPDIALQLVRNPRRLGVAKNFVEGAFRVSARYYRLVPGDDIEPLETHVSIFEAVGTADILLPVYTTIEGRPLGRTIISRAYTSMVNGLSGNRIGYYNGGPVVLRDDVHRYHVDATGAGFQAEFVTRLISVGRQYRELFVVASDREGSTALSFRNFLSVTHSFLKIALRRLHG
jgi:glycosyltransferase involved in cell wall biosynthesis